MLNTKPSKDSFWDRLLVAWQALERQKGRKVNATEFGRLVGLSQGRISQLQGNLKSPPHDTVERIAMVCGVDPGWLAFGDASRAPAPGEVPGGQSERRTDFKMSQGGIPQSEPKRRLLAQPKDKRKRA